MSIDECNVFARLVGIVENRIKIINQIMGYTVVGARDNPVRLTCVRQVYSVEICGEVFASFDALDLVGVDDALKMLDAYKEGLWLAFRGGILLAA